MTQGEFDKKLAKIKQRFNEDLLDFSEEVEENLKSLYLNIQEEEEKTIAMNNLYSDIICTEESLDDGTLNLQSLARYVTNSKVAFFIFHDLFDYKDIKKYLPLFNKLYHTRYTTIKSFLHENDFTSVEDWEDYVRGYALDYQNNFVLKRS